METLTMRNGLTSKALVLLVVLGCLAGVAGLGWLLVQLHVGADLRSLVLVGALALGCVAVVYRVLNAAEEWLDRAALEREGRKPPR